MRPWLLRFLISVVWIFIIALVWLAISYPRRPVEIATQTEPPTQVEQATPVEPAGQILQPSPSPTPVPSLSPSPSPPPSPIAPPSFVGQLHLIIPVAGVRPDQLLDTYDDARSEGREHDAIDIMAPANTPVLAAADGKIMKLFQSDRGGTTIYQSSSDEKMIFYYAHLAGYANGLSEGSFVRQGDVIAYVGDTGNAGAGNYHLHFSIALVTDPKRYWEGTNINPFPMLRR